MKEFTPKWIAKAREQMKHISPLPWKVCSCGKCGMITGEKDLIATATRGDWGDDYPIIKPVGGSIGGQYEVVMEQITYGHVPPETGNINAQYIAEACNNYPEALNHIERLQKRIAELEMFEGLGDRWSKQYYRDTDKLKARVKELEAVNEDQALTISQNDYAYTIDREMIEKRIAELEHYKRLNEEWVHEKVEELTSFEEVEKMIMIADKLNKSNASIHCGWCDAEFETRDKVKEHAYGCKDNPLAQRIDKYNHLIVNLFSFLERDRLVRAHAKEMSEFIQEYREIKKDLPQSPQEEE